MPECDGCDFPRPLRIGRRRFYIHRDLVAYIEGKRAAI
jgi:hypothetical protein